VWGGGGVMMTRIDRGGWVADGRENAAVQRAHSFELLVDFEVVLIVLNQLCYLRTKRERTRTSARTRERAKVSSVTLAN
jgi:hypothetical protein